MFDRVLNMLWFEFWICQGSEYGSGSEYIRVLIYYDSVYTRVTKGSEYARVFPKYARFEGIGRIWLNLPVTVIFYMSLL